MKSAQISLFALRFRGHRSKGFPVKAFASMTALDSFVYWGFFNAIIEQKEYGEGYVLEKLARATLAKDANLKKEFVEKLKDENFAKNLRTRLNLFYERSPYYTDQRVNFYPVGRVVANSFKVP